VNFSQLNERDQAIRALADAAADDVKLDFPAMDVNYDLYTEDLPGYGYIGVIDMGEVFQAAFAWDQDHWELLNHNPVTLRDAIIARRQG
jgi:hypothetical protein